VTIDIVKRGESGVYQTAGIAMAKTFSFICIGGCTSASAKCGDSSAPWIFGLYSSMLVGVVGDADEAGEVELE